MRAPVLLALVLAATGCGSNIATPTDPPPLQPTIETFSGSVAVGGTSSHAFDVKYSNGTMSATLTAAGPPADVLMGFAIGSQDGAVCTPLSGASTVTRAGQNARLQGTVAGGSYCVIVYDAGFQEAPVTYAVTVSHY